ncbi:MAG: DUF2946 family protein [Novosphingobium sp.]
MQAFRAIFRSHRRLALGVLALALAIKALVPAGYMLGDTAHVLTIAICAEASGQQLTKQIVVPSDGKSGTHAKAEGTCAWGLLAMAALGAADVLLLALALAFILTLGLAPRRPAARAQRTYLRPPLRGPPAFA